MQLIMRELGSGSEGASRFASQHLCAASSVGPRALLPYPGPFVLRLQTLGQVPGLKGRRGLLLAAPDTRVRSDSWQNSSQHKASLQAYCTFSTVQLLTAP